MRVVQWCKWPGQMRGEKRGKGGVRRTGCGSSMDLNDHLGVRSLLNRCSRGDDRLLGDKHRMDMKMASCMMRASTMVFPSNISCVLISRKM